MNIDELFKQNFIEMRLVDMRKSHVDTAKNTRTCHMCRCKIRKHDKHFAVHNSSKYNFWMRRTNVCFICLELILQEIKVPMYGTIKQRRREHNAEIVLRSI